MESSRRPAVPPRSLLALAACALLVLAFAPAQYFGRQEDDAIFVIAARSLTAGRFCLETLPGCPPIARIDPGLPLLLTPLALLTDRFGPFQAFMALLLALTPAAVWAWLRRRADETTALLAAALFASSPLVLSQSGVVMSEIPFVLLMIGSLAAAEAGKAGLTGAAGAALLLTRTAGVSIVPGLAAAFRRKRPRALAAALVPPLAAVALWTAWSMATRGSAGKLDHVSSTYAGAAWTKVFSVAASNARFYAGELGGGFLPPRLADGASAALLGAGLALAAAWGAARALRRRADEPAAWALAGSALMLALWGWQYERYLLPVLPLLLWTAVAGWGRAAKPALAVLLFLQLGTQTLPRLGRPSPWAVPELTRSYAWLSARPRPALFASAQPVRDGLLSGTPAVFLPDAASAEEFAAALKAERAGYVLRAGAQDYGLAADPAADIRVRLERAYSQLDDERLFRKVHEEPAERAAIYEPR